MPGDPKECRERAKRCMHLSHESTNPVLKQNLFDIAKVWMRLATELEVTRRLLDEWGEPASTVRLKETMSSGHGFGNAIAAVRRIDQALPINNFDAPTRQPDDALAVKMVEGAGDASAANAEHQR
jgi:hypothetical protein